MSFLANDARALKVWFDEDNMWVLLTDGRQLSVPLAYFPRLIKATQSQRENYEMSGAVYGIHWEELDEDIHVQSLLIGQYEKLAV